MAVKKRITICVPTKNRPEFLSRLLKFFADTHFTDWIYIGDASDKAHILEGKKVITQFEKKLNIKHFECPEMNVDATFGYMNQYVTTPYCTCICDDDFLCVNGINKCIDFLEKNPEYGAAHGKAIAVIIDRNGPCGNIGRTYQYQQAILEGESGSQRLEELLRSLHTVIFSVHHTKDWQEMFHGFQNQTPWARQGFIFDELVPSVISSVRNKMKELDFLYLVRFGHSQQYNQIDIRSWLDHPDWQIGYKVLRDKTIDELMHQDDININAAEEVFNKAFSSYMKRIKKDIPRGKLMKMRKSLMRLSKLNAAYAKCKFQVYQKDKNNLLSTLLKPTSPYHDDFMPIYEAITKPIAKKRKT